MQKSGSECGCVGGWEEVRAVAGAEKMRRVTEVNGLGHDVRLAHGQNLHFIPSAVGNYCRIFSRK